MRKILSLLIALAAIVFAACSPASAQMMLTGAGCVKAQCGGGGGTPTYTYLASPAFQDFPGSPVTFASQPLGTVGANNYTIVAVQMTNGGPLTVTIGGVSATVFDPGSGGSALAWALTPSSTGNIVVTCSGVNTIGIQIAQVTNVTTVGTPTASVAFGSENGTWNAGTVAIPTNGIAVVSLFEGANTGVTPSVTGMTVDSPMIVDPGSTSQTFIAHTTTTGSVTPTITYTSPHNGATVIAVFSP
jgi:hypothetical protein